MMFLDTEILKGFIPGCVHIEAVDMYGQCGKDVLEQSQLDGQPKYTSY